MALAKTAILEKTEWTSFRWHNAPDLEAKRVLLIGDSTIVGHGFLLQRLMGETS
jgi:hypothetical protein